MEGYTEETIREEWDRVKHEDEPMTELEGVLSEVYRKVGEDTEAVEAVIAFMIEKSPGPHYSAAAIRTFADRFQIVYKDHEDVARNELDSLIGSEIDRFLTYMDLPRLGADLVNDDQDHYFEHGGRIYYFGTEA